MQKIYRASLSFKLLKTAKKPAFGGDVINALSVLVEKDKTEQKIGLKLPVPLKELRIINDDLKAALTAALAGNSAIIKTAVIQWDAAFTLTADYISFWATGDEKIISSTGFAATKNEVVPAQKAINTLRLKNAVNAYV